LVLWGGQKHKLKLFILTGKNKNFYAKQFFDEIELIVFGLTQKTNNRGYLKKKFQNILILF